MRELSRRPSGACGLWLLLACVIPPAAGADDSQSLANQEGTLGSGAQIYQHICQGCHMASGEGATGAGYYPKLADDPALVSWQYVAITVLNGKNGMPAFGSAAGGPRARFAAHLSDAQVAAVVNYVRSNFGNHWKERVTANEVGSLPHPATLAEE